MDTNEYGTEEVVAILVTASTAALADGIDPQFRVAAFGKAVDVILAKSMAGPGPERESVSIPHAASAPEGATSPATPAAGMLGMIASRLKVSLETVAEVYDESDGKLEIIAPSPKLDSRKAPATKDLTILVSAGRQAAGLEEWTDADEIRTVADGYRKYDSANFATTIKEMEDLLRVKQTGRKITVRLGRPGWDRATELVKKLGGEVE